MEDVPHTFISIAEALPKNQIENGDSSQSPAAQSTEIQLKGSTSTPAVLQNRQRDTQHKIDSEDISDVEATTIIIEEYITTVRSTRSCQNIMVSCSIKHKPIIGTLCCIGSMNSPRFLTKWTTPLRMHFGVVGDVDSAALLHSSSSSGLKLTVRIMPYQGERDN